MLKPPVYLPVLILMLLQTPQATAAFDPAHSEFARILAAVVIRQGPRSVVRYDRLKARPAILDHYLAQVSAVSRDEFEHWPRANRIAFLINAYNALTLKLVRDAYPGLNSIKDLGGLFSSPWQRDFFRLFGESHDLDYIEHDLLRGRFHEPRIHFAIVCASRSCPPPQPWAYRADRLEAQLEQVTRNFLRDPSRNRYDAARHRLSLSPIFKWFGGDFIRAAGSIPAFVARYITDDPVLRREIAAPVTGLDYLGYDWSLNAAPAGHAVPAR